MHTNARGRGFTLIELLVVMAIIMVLTSIGVPVYHKVKANAYALKCVANLRAIGAGLTSYRTSYEGWMPYVLTPVGEQDRAITYENSSKGLRWKYELTCLITDPGRSPGAKDEVVLSEIFFDPVPGRGKGNFFLSKRHFGSTVEKKTRKSDGTFVWKEITVYHNVPTSVTGGAQSRVIVEVEPKGYMQFAFWTEPSRAAILAPAKSSGLQRGLGRDDGGNVNVEYRHAGKANILFLDEHVKQFAKGDDSLWLLFDEKYNPQLRSGKVQYYVPSIPGSGKAKRDDATIRQTE